GSAPGGHPEGGARSPGGDMSVVRNRVRRGAYFDSVALMRVAQRVKALAGVEEAGLMIGTPANRDVLADAGILTSDGRAAGPADVVMAVRAASEAEADAALEAAERFMSESRASVAEASAWRPRTLRT